MPQKYHQKHPIGSRVITTIDPHPQKPMYIVSYNHRTSVAGIDCGGIISYIHQTHLRVWCDKHELNKLIRELAEI